jgi:hypothetical protein
MKKSTAIAHLRALVVLVGASIGLAHAQDIAAPPALASSELQTQVEALLESGPFEIQGAHVAYPNVI